MNLLVYKHFGETRELNMTKVRNQVLEENHFLKLKRNYFFLHRIVEISVRNTFCSKTSLQSVSEVNITWFVVFFNPHKPLRKKKKTKQTVGKALINGEGGTSAPSVFCCVTGDGIPGLRQPENTCMCWLLGVLCAVAPCQPGVPQDSVRWLSRFVWIIWHVQTCSSLLFRPCYYWYRKMISKGFSFQLSVRPEKQQDEVDEVAC